MNFRKTNKKMKSLKILLCIVLPLCSQCFFDPTFGNSSYPKFNETALETEMLEFQDEQAALKFFKEKSIENALIGRRYLKKLRIKKTIHNVFRVIYHGIRNGWHNLSEYLITNYYNPNNIDLYMTFLDARKKLNSKFLPIFERLVFALPQQSIFLKV